MARAGLATSSNLGGLWALGAVKGCVGIGLKRTGPSDWDHQGLSQESPESEIV